MQSLFGSFISNISAPENHKQILLFSENNILILNEVLDFDNLNLGLCARCDVYNWPSDLVNVHKHAVRMKYCSAIHISPFTANPTSYRQF